MAKVLEQFTVTIKLDTWYLYGFDDKESNFYFKLNSEVKDEYGRYEITYVDNYKKNVSKDFISLQVLCQLSTKYYKLADNQQVLESLYG